MFDLNELELTLVSALINGVMLFFGIYLGSRLGARSMKKEVKTLMDESTTLKILARILNRLDAILAGEDIAEKAGKFFEEAARLLSSEEARNFFKNLSELMEMLTKKPVEPLLKLPKMTACNITDKRDS